MAAGGQAGSPGAAAACTPVKPPAELAARLPFHSVTSRFWFSKEDPPTKEEVESELNVTVAHPQAWQVKSATEALTFQPAAENNI